MKDLPYRHYILTAGISISSRMRINSSSRMGYSSISYWWVEEVLNPCSVCAQVTPTSSSS